MLNIIIIVIKLFQFVHIEWNMQTTHTRTESIYRANPHISFCNDMDFNLNHVHDSKSQNSLMYALEGAYTFAGVCESRGERGGKTDWC